MRIHIPRNMETTQRSHLASLVKRNGGKAEQGLDGCQVAIFDLNQPVKGRHTLHAAQEYQPPIPVVAPAWIEDCVDAKKLLDEKDGAYNPVAILERKRLRQDKMEERKEAEAALGERNNSLTHSEKARVGAGNAPTAASAPKRKPSSG